MNISNRWLHQLTLLLLLLGTCIPSLRAAPAGGLRQTKLLHEFRQGPLSNLTEIVFSVRKVNPTDGHWYANFGYYAAEPDRKAWAEGTRLCRLNLQSGELNVILEDPRGGVRDPQVHHDGDRILFSYRKGGTEHYHLYTIKPDGSGLQQLTGGPFDDFEPAYLPDGSIVFVSSRCKRWVNCWLTQVAVLHRCDADGKNIRAISSNNEHDNTPWPLPDGRVLYTRWEYVDRSQVHYHHLWSANPDGTMQSTWFGNFHPGTTMIDAKPIPGTGKVVASFSPGHGQKEHDGFITVVDPAGGPDHSASARQISQKPWYRDPWAFTENAFLAAQGPALILMNGEGRSEEIFRLSEADRKEGFQCHEPRPLSPRPRELIIQPRATLAQATGRMVLANVYDGRNMEGVQPGDIKKLLVLETLPMPIHYTGGMEPISYGGTFTLERILGTVPVEPDGSAYFEVPALRSVFFVALDDQDMSVKRMQSFTAVQPGEVLSCVGCHEHRTRTPEVAASGALAALNRGPSKIEPIPHAPDVIDFPRDIQPILDQLCTDCHGYEKTDRGGPRSGRLVLTGDRGPLYSHSYYMLTIGKLFSDGRNQPTSSYRPRTLGSSASRILKMLDGSHHDVQATPAQKKLLRLWIESGAAYPGTYAALGGGMIGNYAENKQINTGHDWPDYAPAVSAIQNRCVSCHDQPSRLLPTNLADERGVSFWQPSMEDPRLLTSRHIVFNLSRPEKSLILLAPLARSAGGWDLCSAHSTNAQPVFAGQDDKDYQAILALCRAGAHFLNETSPRFDSPNFRPPQPWIREMQRYGILSENIDKSLKINVYSTEQDYWRSLWYLPSQQAATSH